MTHLETVRVVQQTCPGHDAAMTGNTSRAHTRFALVASVATAVLLLSALQVAAADVPTEKTEKHSKVPTAAAEYDQKRNGGCDIGQQTVDDVQGLAITCATGEYISLLYKLRLPRAAILPTAQVDYDTIKQSSQSFSGPELYRGPGSVDIYVGFSGRGSWFLRSVGLDYAVPTKVDRRPCVTDGEWARVSVFVGGLGGSQKQIAEIFDTDGRRTKLVSGPDGFGYQVRVYQRCDSPKVREIEFHPVGGRGWHSYWG